MTPAMRRIIAFGAVGLVNTGVDFLAFLLLTRWAGIEPLAANVVSFSLGAINSYVLNRLVTFTDSATPLSAPGAMGRFAAVTLFGLLVSSVTLAGGLALSFGEIAAKAGAIVATFFTGYLLTRRLVFAPAGATGARAPRVTDGTVQTRLAIGGAIIATLAPVAFVATPALGDYVNHAVRLWLLAGGIGLAPLDAMYEARWDHASTNAAVDVVAAALSRLAPASAIAPGLLGLSFVLPPLGAALLNMAIFGRAHWWQVLVFLLAFGFTSINGLMNFHIGLGLALLAAALDVRLQHGSFWRLVGLRTVAAAALFSVHAFALLFYFALIAGLMLGRDLPSPRNWRALLARGMGAGLALLPPGAAVALLMLGSPTLPGAHLSADSPGARAPPSEFTIHWQGFDLIDRLGMMLVPIRTYSHFVDIGFLVVLAAPVVAAAAWRRLALHQGLLVTGLVLAAAAHAMPEGIHGTWWIEKRLPNMAALTMAASLQPRIATFGALRATAVAVALFLVALRAAWVADVWIAQGADTRSVERALGHVPAGAAILPMHNLPADAIRIWSAPKGRFLYGEPAYRHYPTLAIMQRHAFVPTLFTARGKQPITVRSPWSEIAVPEGDLAQPMALTDEALIRHRFPYVGLWRTRFDYLLLLNADLTDRNGPLPADPALQLVADEGFARLYRIIRESGARPAPPSTR
jgi:putative flippase GtrA